RQGNNNAEVQIFRYVTEGSFDDYMWQTLETKAKFIAQVMSGDRTIRRLEDLDSAALTYAEVKAIASDNPLVIEKAQVDAELMRLARLRSAHAEEQFRIRTNRRHAMEEADTALGTIRSLESTVQGFDERAGRLEKVIEDTHKRATELEAKIGRPFEHEEHYEQLTRRQTEITEKLDLTKNQAASQLDGRI